jgi:hypothetical protein
MFSRHSRSLFPGNSFLGAETAPRKGPFTFNLSSAETKRPDENPSVGRYLHDTGKSLFVRDCVVELGGLEPQPSGYCQELTNHGALPTSRIV